MAHKKKSMSGRLRTCVWTILLMVAITGCNGQAKTEHNMKNETELTNPLMCDPVEGICGIPDSTAQTGLRTQKTAKPIKVIYFTDPICSSCWGIEPQLRKLKLEYGQDIEME